MLEGEHVSLIQERSVMVSKRRKADDEDDLSAVLGILPVPAPEIGTEQIDELGRVVPSANPSATRRDRASARDARRTLRRAKQNKQEQEEGYSTDSSLPPSDAADFEVAIEKLLAKRDDILSDVRAKDFKNPGLGLSKWFGEWRDRFGDSYTGAWGGLGMVGAWEFWTRLEILGWDPLQVSGTFTHTSRKLLIHSLFQGARSLDTFAWYKSLYEYSRPRLPDADEEEEPELGPDGDLVSAMISTAIIPRLCKIIDAGGFDPYSARDLRTLVDVVEQIEASVAREDLKFQVSYSLSDHFWHGRY